MKTNRVITGDLFDVIEDLPANSVHAVVTDPPYGLAFMGKTWDSFDPYEYQDFSERWATAVDRVLRPGGHLLAFSGSRTHHRMFVGIEDAGYEIRDTITWHYGGGFPKGTALDRLIDKRKDAFDDREVVGEEDVDVGMQDGSMHAGRESKTESRAVTKPATEAAKRWEGWSTQLKPATEFVSVARSPIAEKTVIDNVLEWATGALNIDGGRIPLIGDGWEEDPNFEGGSTDYVDGERGKGINNSGRSSSHDDGRYPPNAAFDEDAALMLDDQSGERPTGRLNTENVSQTGDHYEGWSNNELDGRIYEKSTGGASRFFYCAKASKSERTADGAIENDHPTVKPVDLMEWLVKLVTARGQTVLDPFAGSGTTLMACKNTGRQYVGIEKDERYADIARERVGIGARDPDRILNRPEGQESVDEFF